SLAYHPDGRRLAMASLQSVIYVWDVDGSGEAKPIAGHRERVTSVAYSPDGAWLVSASEDRTLRVWHAESGEPRLVRRLETPARFLAFSTDGRYLFTANGNTTCYQVDWPKLLEG